MLFLDAHVRMRMKLEWEWFNDFPHHHVTALKVDGCMGTWNLSPELCFPLAIFKVKTAGCVLLLKGQTEKILRSSSADVTNE